MVMAILQTWLVITVIIALSRLTFVQTMMLNGETIAADRYTVAPAFDVLDPTASNVSAQLFPGETRQLTDAILANLTALQLTNISLFCFQDDTPVDSATFGPCKTFPGDTLWPSETTWTVFDLLLGGSLIKTVPWASICYDDFGNHDPDRCAEITAKYTTNSYDQTSDPTEVNAILYQGQTCMPPALSPGATDCTLGAYPAYSVNVTNAAQVQLAVNMARNLNLRLVIKNTGHDFGAKSMGAGSLSIWTHNLRDAEFFEDYNEGNYRGPAIKFGAGVQAYEAYAAARDYGVTIVGGEGKTVGLMGGYIQGGGHSPLSGLYGMAADSVVTADGRFVTASSTQNPDLFWALRGGGGSTYGVVSSVVIKAFPKLPVTTMTFTLATGVNSTAEAWWAGIREFFKGLNDWTAMGHYMYFFIQKQGVDSYSLHVTSWFAPNVTRRQFEAQVEPWFSTLAALDIQVSPLIREYDDFHPAWSDGFPLEYWGLSNNRMTSRILPRSNWKNETLFNDTFAVLQHVVDDGAYTMGIVFNTDAGPAPDNAVNPAWRDSVMLLISMALWDNATTSTDAVEALSRRVTSDWGRRWRDVAPESGTYLSESDYIEPDFQTSFWGAKYGRLLELKRRFDPRDVFYAHMAVGSEGWEMSELIMGHLPSQNSRLCRKEGGGGR